MGVLLVKSGVRFDRIAPAGFRLIGALDFVSRHVDHDLTITCGTEGHPPTDPHTFGEAYDVRSHDLTEEQKRKVLLGVMANLSVNEMDRLIETGGGLATRWFFGWLENVGQPTEHFHFQRRKGTVFTTGTLNA